jgi:hypothetical protein
LTSLFRRLLLAGALLAVVAPASAWGANCRVSESVKDKLDGSPVAFVGRVTAVTRVPGSGGVPFFDYRFTVDHAVKGLSAKHVTVRATKLVDIDNQVVTPSKVTIGVLAATRPGGVLVTNSCALVDPASLMGASDEPKGGAIKVVIGLVILGIVVLYSLRRLKRRREAMTNDLAFRPDPTLDAARRKNGGSDRNA